MKRGVTLERRSGIATVSMPAGCVLGVTTAQELISVAEAIADDDESAVVVVRSRGKHFCGGCAAGEPPDWPAALRRIRQPIIAVQRGDAVGEGAELALAADIRILARSARLRFSHLSDGRLPRCGATQILPRLVGRSRALDLLLSGRWLGAAEAQRIGVAAQVVAERQLSTVARQLTKGLAQRGRLALRYAKEAIRAGADMTLQQGMALEQDLYVLLQTTQDRAEGIRSFVEKRPPRFRGQ